MVRRVVIRVSKEDSARVYALIEAYEGIAMISTLPHVSGDRWRDLELTVPQLFWEDWVRLVGTLQEELPDGLRIIS